jgi:hypothetical protein
LPQGRKPRKELLCRAAIGLGDFVLAGNFYKRFFNLIAALCSL